MAKNHGVEHTSDPVSAPSEIGQHWINTNTQKEWFSVGIGGVEHWIKRITSHTELADKGMNTHVQIDAHINDTTNNVHNVTAANVGNTVAQWNANKLQGYNVNSDAPTVGYVLTWNGTEWVATNPASGNDISVKVRSTDTTASYLENKLAGTGISFSVDNPTGNAVLRLTVDQIAHSALSEIGTNTHGQIDTFITNTNSSLALKANTADVLTKTNTDIYTPTTQYHPATKGYVDANAGGLKTNSPLEVIPLQATRYYPLGVLNASAPTTIVGAANRCDLYPVVWPEDGLPTDISIVCTTLVAAGNVKIVVYDTDASGYPTTLLHETANLSTATTGVKTATSINTVSFTKGKLYWIGVRWSSATNALRANALASITTIGGMGTTSVATAGTVMQRTITFANAAPNPWVFNSAEIINNILTPSIYLRS